MLSRSVFLARLARQRFAPQSFNVPLRLASSSESPPILTKEETDPDAPVEIATNPYQKEERKCLLCRTGIELDYKNARLLQQFVSTFSGRVYDRHITGLCDHQQEKLVQTIALSRKAGYMPIFVKDPKYTRDPKLFDPLRPIRPHSFA
ncbi:putative ribosomal protein S18 [Teladorsagia circumcincta]|uniref:Putative ribosomal protein S18 n=1 Tax=Teladorsagia circumcincta TaxID=45464 RepID=A0A2G9U593_TELCI|nr:putative ribosomal protein S18 [Teladorsagia circumcincta]